MYLEREKDIMIRFEQVNDTHLDDITTIYNSYILNTTATFNILPLTMEEMKHIVYSGHQRFKSYAIFDQDVLVGYVLLARYKAREAYDKTAEVTVYLKTGCEGKGLGTQAIQFIEQLAVQLDFRALLAVICAENTESVHMFEKSSYFKCGHFREVGEKFGRLLDVVVYEKILSK